MCRTDRAAGVLLGLACGDALGRPVEGYPARSIAAEYGTLTEMVGGGTHRQPAGTVTDDTDLALCIARSLVDRGGFDGADVADRFREWYESDPVGVGSLTADTVEDAVVTAVNRGGDADTVGAVAGAVAGARFGASGIPERWLDVLDHREDLALLARALATTEFAASV